MRTITVYMAAFICNALLAGSGLAAQSGPVAQFTASGTVIDNPCQVSIPASIAFGDIGSTTIFTSNSVPADDHSKVLDIGITDCPAGSAINISFMGTTATIDKTVLATNQEASGAAKNVAVGFWDDAKGDLKVAVNSGVSHTATVLENGSTHFPFLMGLVLDNYTLPAVPGSVSASVQVKINFL